MEKPLFLVIKREVKRGGTGDYVLAASNFFLKREQAVSLRDALDIVYEPRIVRIDGAVATTFHVMLNLIKRKYSRRENGKTPKKESAEEKGTQSAGDAGQGKEESAE